MSTTNPVIQPSASAASAEPSPESSSQASPSAEEIAARPLRREQYIPIDSDHLLEVIGKDLGLDAAQRSSLASLSQLLRSTFHAEFHQKHTDLARVFRPYNPDRDTRMFDAPLKTPAALFEKFEQLLTQANYRRLGPEEIIAATKIASAWGLNLQVDFQAFDHLEVYIRGSTQNKRKLRHWRTYFKPTELVVPIYQRLVVIFRIKPGMEVGGRHDPNAVFIKLFKDIPQADVEMLLPGTEYRISMFDRTRIALPTVSGVFFTLYKVISGALIFAWQGLYGILVTIGVVGGTVGYGVKSFFGYLNTKQKYQLNLTENLYYQNLDNNAGVIFRLLHEAEQQEHREALLAYALLWQRAGEQGWSEQTLDEAAEQLVGNALGEEVDFDVADAVHKLLRLHLVELQPNGSFRAVPLETAAELLRAHQHRIVDRIGT